MVDISKLTPAQQKMVEEFKAGGLSSEELAKLKSAGVNEEILQALKSEFPDTGEVPNKEPVMPEEKGRSVGETVGVGAAIIAGATALGAGIGALVGFLGGGVGAVPGAIGGAKLGAIAGAALVGFTSCTNDIDQEVGINIEKENYDALLKAMQDKEKADQARHEEMMKYLKALGKGMDEIVRMLLIMGAQLDEIIELMIVNGNTTEEIVKLLKEQGKDIKAIYAALGEMNIEQGKQTELLKELVGNDKIEIKYLEEILAEVREGNDLQAKENAILNLILDKLKTLEANDAKGAELLNAILAQLSAFVKQEGDMDAKTHELLKTIIENQATMTDEVKSGVAAILAKLGQMSEADKERFEALVPLLQSLGDQATEILNAIKNGNAITAAQLQTIIDNQGTQTDKLDDIRELIVKNNEIAQGTQNAVKDMSTKMSEEHQAILEAIKNGSAKVDDIQKILVEIKNDTSVLPDMKQQLCVIGSAIEKLLEEVKGIRVETQKGLLAILAKIPDGCNCKPTDLSAIIDLLNKLLDEVQKDPADGTQETPDDGKDDHEGILKDLEDYFG